jgi:hypothetical protein
VGYLTWEEKRQIALEVFKG